MAERTSERRTATLGLDAPIVDPDQDLLDRAPFAAALSRQIVAAPRGGGTVVAVTGAWGDGKTSVMNMTRAFVAAGDDQAIILPFNPWLFEGSQDLVARFFIELSGGLRKNLGRKARLDKRADDILTDYGSVLGPLGEAAQRRREKRTAYDTRDQVVQLLRQLERRVVVVVDDIDRLTGAEIRDVMRLVKLVADFPNMIFILAFDRRRVERALGEGLGGDAQTQAREGRDYLAKIVQVAAELPAIQADRLHELFVLELSALLKRLGRQLPDDSRTQVLLRRVVGPLLGNVRDLRRYIASIGMSIELIGDEINLSDVLALEAMRLFLPEVTAALAPNVEALTRFSALVEDPRRDAEQKDQLEKLIELGGPSSEVVRHGLGLLFPATERVLTSTYHDPTDVRAWRRDRRVAVSYNLLFYLARSRGSDEVANADVAAVLRELGQPDSLEALLETFDDVRLRTLVLRLRDYDDAFAAEHAATAAGAFLNVADKLPPTKRSNLGFDEQAQLVRMVGYILGKANEDERARIYERLYANAASMSIRWLILAGSKRRSDDHDPPLPPMPGELHDRLTNEFERALLQQSAGSLQAEPHLPHLFEVLASAVAGPEHLRKLGEDDDFLVTLLRSVVVGTYSDRHVAELPWGLLVDTFGQEWLARRIAELESRGLGGGKVPPDVIDVARHYLDHGRPLQIGDD